MYICCLIQYMLVSLLMEYCASMSCALSVMKIQYILFLQAVHEDIHDEVVTKLKKAYTQVRIGDPLDCKCLAYLNQVLHGVFKSCGNFWKRKRNFQDLAKAKESLLFCPANKSMFSL